MRTCKYCGCCLPDGADTCIACGKSQNQKREDIMTNQRIKENLLILLQEYTQRGFGQESKDNARKTVVLALKAIDAYGKELDEE